MSINDLMHYSNWQQKQTPNKELIKTNVSKAFEVFDGKYLENDADIS